MYIGGIIFIKLNPLIVPVQAGASILLDYTLWNNGNQMRYLVYWPRLADDINISENFSEDINALSNKFRDFMRMKRILARRERRLQRIIQRTEEERRLRRRINRHRRLREALTDFDSNSDSDSE